MACSHGEHGNRYRQGKAAGTGAARIDKENVVTPFGDRLVGMARNDDAKAGSNGIEGELCDVMQNMDRVSAYLDRVARRKADRPRALVVIAPNRAHRRKVSERFQHGRVADIASVNDEIRFAQRIQCLWPHQPVSI